MLLFSVCVVASGTLGRQKDKLRKAIAENSENFLVVVVGLTAAFSPPRSGRSAEDSDNLILGLSAVFPFRVRILPAEMY